MGHSLHYQAIPTSSTFYARLREDRAFITLFRAFLGYGWGAFWFFEIEADEVEEILEGAFERYRAILGPEPEARQRVAEYRAELERTRAAFPGVESRTASLEQFSQEIRERLTRELARTRGDATQLADKLLFGEGDLAPHLGLPEENSLGVVSVAVVGEGATVLWSIDPVVLFPEEWHRENFDSWRQLYLATTGKSEVIVMGIV
jgi:hypothetical protein